MIEVEYKVGGKTIKVEYKELQRVFNNFRKAVINRARKILKKEDKVASGRLYKDITLKFIVEKNTIGINPFTKGADYWKYVDQGVQGARDNKKAPESPFKFGTGTGPRGELVSAIDRWTIVKPIPEVRDERGRFIPRKELVRRISRSVYLYGLRPTNFITDPLRQMLEKYELDIQGAIADDLTPYVEELLNEDPVTITFEA